MSQYYDLNMTGQELSERLDKVLQNQQAIVDETARAKGVEATKANIADVHDIWNKLSDMTGEVLNGISLTVTPSYYIGEDGCTVNITADSSGALGKFEHIAFYANNELIGEDHNVTFYQNTVVITGTTQIRCVATIASIEYEQTKTITHYSSFWLGAGMSYSDVMTNENLIPIADYMRGAYDRTVDEGDHIIVVVGESLAQGFIRADINGIEIQMAESSVVVDGNNYKVFTSVDTYNAGVYNIDING